MPGATGRLPLLPFAWRPPAPGPRPSLPSLRPSAWRGGSLFPAVVPPPPGALRAPPGLARRAALQALLRRCLWGGSTLGSKEAMGGDVIKSSGQIITKNHFSSRRRWWNTREGNRVCARKA